MIYAMTDDEIVEHIQELGNQIENLEYKLTKALELALEECPYRDGNGSYNDWWHNRRATVAELRGK
jgi:hypothetical protein